MRVNGGNVGTYAVRETGEILGVLPVPDEVDLDNCVIESWGLYSEDGRLLKEGLMENYVITDSDPAVMYMQANTRNLTKLPLKLYANRSDTYDKDELVAQFDIEEYGFASLTLIALVLCAILSAALTRFAASRRSIVSQRPLR